MVSGSVARLERDRSHEEASYFPSAEGLVFGVTYVPARPLAGVLVCPSLLGELIVNYRREVRLARALAETGIAVQRFHYRGTGHSDGEHGRLTLQSMTDDARAALQVLRERAQVQRIGLLGTRWGALIAARCAREVEDAPVVLWQPVMEAELFVKEAIRARLLRRLRKNGGPKTTEAQELAELSRVGWLDVLGYRLDAGLVASVRGLSLVETLSGEPRRAAVFELGRRSGTSGDHLKLTEGLREAGLQVDADCLPQEPPVWFSSPPAATGTSLIDATVEWLVAAFEGAASDA